MSGFKGTKGPWEANGQDGTPGHCFQAQIWRPDGFCLAEIEPTSDPIEATANALLISKAPEMLEMLESVVAMFAKGQILTVDRVVKKRDEINQLIKSATEP